MNTERPDNDDAEARAAAGSTDGTGGASGNDGTADAPERARESAPPGSEAARPDAVGGTEGTGTTDADTAGDDPTGTGTGRTGTTDADTAGDDPTRTGAGRTGTAQGVPPEAGARQARTEGTGSADDGSGAVGRSEPESGAGTPSAADGDRPDEVRRSTEGHGGEPSARRRSPALVASVAAAVLLVGGGGAYLAAEAAGGSGGGAGTTPGANGDATPPPLDLDGHSEAPENGIAPGEPNPYGATYRAEGTLPDGPGSAPVFGVRGEVGRQQVTALAKALGLDGKPVEEGGSWRIGGQDGSGPTLRVDRAAPGSWTYSRNTPGTDNCKGATCESPGSDDGPVVGEAAARKAAAPLLKAVGQDDAKVDASRITGGKRVVNADPEVGGLPTYGWTTAVVVGAGGEVVGGNGRLTEPVKGDVYPTVSAAKALELMNAAPDDPRAGVAGCATAVPLEEGPQEECAPGTEPAGDTVAVGDAVFGLAAHSVDGRPALVPSWLFEVRPEGAEETLTVTYPAVDPEFLAPRPQPDDSGPAPSRPGDEPTSGPAAGEAEVEGYTAEGKELTVVFSGGVCADYKVTASESEGRVTVRVTETPWPDKVCIMIAKQYQQTVPLEAPLGDREVVGTGGDPVPLYKDGARLPAPPTR